MSEITNIQVCDDGPPRMVARSNYSPIWDALEKLPEGKWLKFTVTYTKDDKKGIIHRARRAGQRYFETSTTHRLVSRIIPIDEYSSEVWFQKAPKI